MQDLILKFPHLPEKILQKLDSESLFKCREVSRPWQNIIDGRNYPWLRTVNIPTILKERNSYLHLASATGQIEAFEIALNQEGDVNIKNEHDETSFHLACKNGHFKIVQFLIKNADLEIDFNAKENFRGHTGFHLACQQGHLDVVKIIVENKTALSIDLNSKGKLNDTAFQVACAYGHSDIVKILMENSASLGIDPNETNLGGLSPFILACNHANSDTVNIFMKNAANLDIDLNAKTSKIQKSFTGFHLACAKGYTNVVKILLKNAANLNIDLNRKCRDGYSAFNMACKNNRSEVVKILKKNSKALSINLNKCPHCEKLSASAKTLARHISVIHRKKKLLICDNCSKNFGTKQELKRHVFDRKIHTTGICS